MSSSSEFLPFIEKLNEKSSEGKVPWKGTYKDTTFAAVLEGAGTFQVHKAALVASGRDLYGLTMEDELNNLVLELAGYEPTENTSPENDALYGQLRELYDRARRSALRVDEVVSRASSLLDKL